MVEALLRAENLQVGRPVPDAGSRLALELSMGAPPFTVRCLKDLPSIHDDFARSGAT